MPLTLLVPDLLHPDGAPDALRGLRLPGLERALGLARHSRQPVGARDALFGHFGIAPGSACAPFTARAAGLEDPGRWFRADPVHLRIERDALVLHDAAVLGLTRAEVDEAVSALGDFFGSDGIRIVATDPHRWHASAPAGEAPSAPDLDAMTGRNPFGHLPSGGGRLRWASMLSEAQMLLSGLALNAAREARGAPALNGLWFWGAGEEASPSRSPAAVHGEDPLVRGLALAAGLVPAPSPDSLARLPARPCDDILVHLDSPAQALRRADPAAWREAALELDRRWFADLARLAGAHGGIRIELPAAGATLVASLGASDRLRFWRRPRRLDGLA